MADDPLRMMEAEFALWGVKFQHTTRGSGHIELRWQVDPTKEIRSHIVAKTPSDHRWFMNERAAIRRMFRADGLVLKEQVVNKPKQTKIERALSIPTHVEHHDTQIRMLRAEVADLTEIVLALKDRLEDVLTMPAAVEAPLAPPPQPVIVEKLSSRSKKAIEYVSTRWNSIEALARDMEVPLKTAIQKLNYLAKSGKIEIMRGQCRLKPAPEPAPEPAPAPAAATVHYIVPKKSKAVAASTIERRKAREAKALATIKGIRPKGLNGHKNGHGAN